jgi:hypothetical protein
MHYSHVYGEAVENKLLCCIYIKVQYYNYVYYIRLNSYYNFRMNYF